MRILHLLTILFFLVIPSFVSAACTPNTTSITDIQAQLTAGGAGFVLQLCQNQIYSLTDVLNFTAASQEISTENYPTDSSRAVLLVSGSTMSTAVQASNTGLNDIKLRNIQINGNRLGADINPNGGANIEIGGANANQLVEYVKSFDPRGWSCLHIAEGPFSCTNATIQNNDIGPCGHDYFQNWADGISLSCSNSLVQNNVIVDPTDGAIVVFGAPYSIIRNNTISVKTRTLLGGINLVDVLPWLPEGNFSHTHVEGNFINGGFATGYGNATEGTNNASAIIKVGIGIGPKVWWGDNRYGTNQSNGGVVENNQLSGAFAFGMALGGVANFVIQNNSFVGNVSIIGDYGPNCTTGNDTPAPPVPLLSDNGTLTNVTITLPPPQTQYPLDNYFFTNGRALGLICFMPPSTTTTAWPYGGGQINSNNVINSGGSGTANSVNAGATVSVSASSASASTSTSGAIKSMAAMDRWTAVVIGLSLVSALSAFVS